mmetsp:Transcript_5504/g.15780  ORF Transcript_5504/g.15780 Transcript_5504/m.15780 type:complete len:225 (-) Transcript_5504:1352-2026(-)
MHDGQREVPKRPHHGGGEGGGVQGHRAFPVPPPGGDGARGSGRVGGRREAVGPPASGAGAAAGDRAGGGRLRGGSGHCAPVGRLRPPAEGARCPGSAGTGWRSTQGGAADLQQRPGRYAPESSRAWCSQRVLQRPHSGGDSGGAGGGGRRAVGRRPGCPPHRLPRPHLHHLPRPQSIRSAAAYSGHSGAGGTKHSGAGAGLRRRPLGVGRPPSRPAVSHAPGLR